MVKKKNVLFYQKFQDWYTFSKKRTHCLSWQWPCRSLLGFLRVEGQIIKSVHGMMSHTCLVRTFNSKADLTAGVS